MIVIHLAWCKPGIEKGRLFGRRHYPPITTLNLGFCKIIKLDEDGSLNLRTAMEGLLEDSGWLLDNHSEIEKRIKERVKNTQNAELERYKGYYESLLESKSELAEQLTKRNTEVWHLKEALRIVKGEDNAHLDS